MIRRFWDRANISLCVRWLASRGTHCLVYVLTCELRTFKFYEGSIVIINNFSCYNIHNSFQEGLSREEGFFRGLISVRGLISRGFFPGGLFPEGSCQGAFLGGSFPEGFLLGGLFPGGFLSGGFFSGWLLLEGLSSGGKNHPYNHHISKLI